MSTEQKQDMQMIFPGVKNLDFVCGWYKKASEYIENTRIETCFVSTNSIVQGETVARFWQFLPLLGASEYIKGKKKWCLWLEDATPNELQKCPLVMDRIKKCKESRENSIAAGIRKFAATPALFAQRTQPTDKDFIIVPRVSSENRRYVPIGFIKAGTIVNDAVQIIPDTNLYYFGILISNVHMAWMRAVCGRLKSDYRYSKDIVYNNFP